MVSIQALREMALALPGAEEKPHFDITSFRVKNKIFATLHEKTNRAMVKLNIVDQSVFCGVDRQAIYPVPGGWGVKGATFFDLDKVQKDVLEDALQHAWLGVTTQKTKGKPGTGGKKKIKPGQPPQFLLLGGLYLLFTTFIHCNHLRLH